MGDGLIELRVALCAKGLVRLPRPGITSSLPPAPDYFPMQKREKI